MSSEARLTERLSRDHEQLRGQYHPGRLARRVARQAYLRNVAKPLLLTLSALFGLVVSLVCVRTLLSLLGTMEGSPTLSGLTVVVAYGLPVGIGVAAALFLSQGD